MPNDEQAMGEVIQMPIRNIQHASTEQLMREWSLWAECDEEKKVSCGS